MASATIEIIRGPGEFDFICSRFRHNAPAEFRLADGSTEKFVLTNIEEEGHDTQGWKIEGHTVNAPSRRITGFYNVHNRRGRLQWKNEPVTCNLHAGPTLQELALAFVEGRVVRFNGEAIGYACSMKSMKLVDGDLYIEGTLTASGDMYLAAYSYKNGKVSGCIHVYCR